jgi:hypothetical protein
VESNAPSYAFLIRLIRADVGFEEELTARLRAKWPSAVFFKTFGKYDILQVSELRDIHEAVRADTDNLILEINSFPCFCWYREPGEFLEKLRPSIAPTLTFLKLQEPIFQIKGLDGIEEVSQYLYSRDNLFGLMGTGYHEILLFGFSSGFEAIFRYMNGLRKLRIRDVFPTFVKAHREKALFARTATIPLISYGQVIEGKKWTKLEGKVTPTLTIRCVPGHEDYLVKLWPADWKLMLGTEDLLCRWNRPVPLKKYVKALLEFRQNAKQKLSVFNTTTRLFHAETVVPDSNHAENPPPAETRKLFFKEELRSLERRRRKGNTPFIVGEITNIASLINTHIGNTGLQSSYSDIIYSIRFLNGILKKYVMLGDEGDPSDLAVIEDDLLQYADCVRAAMAQHFPPEDYSEFSGIGIPLPFASSLSRIIRAISTLPEQFFQIISRSDPPRRLVEAAEAAGAEEDLIQSRRSYDLPWKGFLFLNLAEGYQCLGQSEIFYVPYKDIFNPLNWTTLTHEIAHAYYERIDFGVVENGYLQDLRNLVEQGNSRYVQYADTLEGTCQELFVHWFDYRHFFDADLEFCLWSIWRTWVDIPRVYQFKEDYWLRTLFLTYCHVWPEVKSTLDPIYTKQQLEDETSLQILEVLNPYFDKATQFIYKHFLAGYPGIKLKDSEWEKVYDTIVIFLDLRRYFEAHYVNELIISGVSETYPDLDEHARSIFDGKVVKMPIPNPLLLLREILRKFYAREENAHLSDSALVALIYSFWEASRHLRRPISRQ